MGTRAFQRPFYVVCFLTGCLVATILSRPLDESSAGHTFQKRIRMPGVVSDRKDALVCHAMKMDQDPSYILEFEPHARKETAHHMVLYGCREPGTKKDWWYCDDMEGSSERSVCGDWSHQIIYAWALDAPAKKLPKDVGFRVGGTTDYQYVVVQLHYREKFKDGESDSTSGVTLHMTHDPQPLQSGYYILASYGYIPARQQEVHVDVACMYDMDMPIHAFSYRTHSHNQGVVTAGYRIRDGVWTEIGRMSPQQPQMFYNTTNGGVDIKKGDVLAARCTMTTKDREEEVIFGATNNDEMCNFYIMFDTTHQDDLKVQMCTRSSPEFHLGDYYENIPALASSLEGVNLRFPKMEHKGHASHKKHQMRLV
ncbi:peptidylglycine alpha-hydroxylating monooxygenase-like [Lineus longissimus]|uniref:peptidylglycine alpha-hydroxylating monooxygenase-like n=1 Tax=Lineus longissimus TaxID=88925 RepID=UPI002B4E75DE